MTGNNAGLIRPVKCYSIIIILGVLPDDRSSETLKLLLSLASPLNYQFLLKCPSSFTLLEIFVLYHVCSIYIFCPPAQFFKALYAFFYIFLNVQIPDQDTEVYQLPSSTQAHIVCQK